MSSIFDIHRVYIQIGDIVLGIIIEHMSWIGFHPATLKAMELNITEQQRGQNWQPCRASICAEASGWTGCKNADLCAFLTSEPARGRLQMHEAGHLDDSTEDKLATKGRRLMQDL